MAIQFARASAPGGALLEGQPGWDLDDHRLYVGDGVTNWWIGSPFTVFGASLTAAADAAAGLALLTAAPLASPTFTGTPAAPTAAGGTNTTQLATTEFVLAEVAASGTVTSVGLAAPVQLSVSGSPVTGAGTLTLAWATQAANKVFAGPSSGGPDTPAFRSLSGLDLPAHTQGASTIGDGFVDDTEFGFLNGVTSAIQTQLDAKQPLAADLSAIAGLTSAADRFPYYTGAGTAALATFTSTGRSVVAAASASAARDALGATSGVWGVATGGTGTGTAFTTGSVVFAGASGVYGQDNASLFFDDTNNRLGVGTASPGVKLQVNGSIVSNAYNEPNVACGVLGGNGSAGLLYARNGSSGFADLYIDATTLRLNTQSNSGISFGTGDLTFGAGADFVFNTTTGTRFGLATTQKCAFHGAAAVIQRAGAAQDAVATTAATNTTPYGFTTAAQADAIITLLNEIRSVLVEKGLMKGSV